MQFSILSVIYNYTSVCSFFESDMVIILSKHHVYLVNV